jgi:hypothetical protein
MAGLHKIVTNTGSIFGISSSQYALWKGNSHPVAGALTFSKLAQGLSKPVEKGLESDVVIFVNPRSWASLMTEQAGARRFDVSYKEAKGNNGFEALEFYSQNGKMQIMSSNYVKEGYAYAINPENFLRVGSTDITFKSPMVKDEFIHLLPDNNGYGIRAYTNQALFCNKIGHQLLFTGIA